MPGIFLGAGGNTKMTKIYELPNFIHFIFYGKNNGNDNKISPNP